MENNSNNPNTSERMDRNRRNNATISPLEPISWIITSIVTSIVLLGFPRIIGMRIDGTWTNFLNVEVVRGMWLFILGWTLLEIVSEAIKLVDLRHSNRVAIVNVVSCLLQMLCVIAIFGNRDIVNPEMMNRLESVEALNNGTWYNNLALHPYRIAMAVMIIILVIEMIEVLAKTYKERHSVI